MSPTTPSNEDPTTDPLDRPAHGVVETAEERAKIYIGFFLGQGDEWRYMVPVDARVGPGERVELSGMVLTRTHPGVWKLDTGTSVTAYALASAAR